jgi:hypothetical protein
VLRDIFEILLPLKADRTIRGTKLPLYVFSVIAIVSFVRSCIHLLVPDGGAGSIAGIDLAVTGASEIIFAFALWGGSQLIYALIQLAVIFRYRSLVPLMYLLLIFETLLRELVGHMKPVTFAHTPPGAIANQIYLPLSIAMLGLSLWSSIRASVNKVE